MRHTNRPQSVVLVDHNSGCLCNWHAERGSGFLFVLHLCRLWARFVFVIVVLVLVFTIALFSRPPKYECLSVNHPTLLQDLLITCAGGLPTTTDSLICGFRALRTLLLLLPPRAVLGRFRIGLLFALPLLIFKFTRYGFLVDTLRRQHQVNANRNNNRRTFRAPSLIAFSRSYSNRRLAL
jgi:hypothetical protein